MRLIVDASVAMKWAVEEPGSEQALSIRRFELLAPELMFAECTNALWKALQRSLLTKADALQKITSLSEVPITIGTARSLARRALEIAIDLAHPSYDALHLAVVETYVVRVVTSDARLLRRLASSLFAHLAIGLQDAAAN